MNVLYISHLSNNVAAGCNWSVPAAVAAQAHIDNVLWIDLNNACQSHWLNIKCYHNIREFRKLKLENLPKPFNCPDIVVFEGFYKLEECFFARCLRRKKIPYIIVPRGSLTYQALHNKSWLKKRIAHWLWFDSFVHGAIAIQYLTKAEYLDSSNKWNKNHIIIPNGFSTLSVRKKEFSTEAIKAIFIGRLDMYHKGLDILLKACVKLKDKLRKVKFSLSLYGPYKYDFLYIKKFITDNGISDFVTLEGEIQGMKKRDAILNADVMVLTSRFEGHPMGLIEALAYGLPCLVSRGSNMFDEIKDYNAGWVCETNEASIEQSLLQLLSEKELLALKGENAYNLSKKYDWNILAKKFHDQILNILNGYTL